VLNLSFVHDHIDDWSKMSFSKNLYGPKLPEWVLKSNFLMPEEKRNPKSKKKLLEDYYQDGNVTTKVVNDPDKKADWEVEETISYSKVFRELLDAKTLCPSNFALNVILELRKWDLEHNKRHNEEFYLGTVARGCRSFASLMREQHLTEIIDEVMKTEAKKKGKKYSLYKTTVRADMKQKTDIMFKYDGDVYRVWSYQTSKSGIECTSRRVAKACGKGYNIMIPFNDGEKVREKGWWLYDREVVHNILKRFVFERDFEPISVEEYQKIVKLCPEFIKFPAIFKV
jgi:hypothetical protein